jgi:hypothetical protein
VFFILQELLPCFIGYGDVPSLNLMVKGIRIGIGMPGYLGIRKLDNLDERPLDLRVYNHLRPPLVLRDGHPVHPMVPRKEHIRCLDGPVFSDETVSVFLVPSTLFSRPVHVIHLGNIATMFGDPYLTIYVKWALRRRANSYLVDFGPCIIILNPNLAHIGLKAPILPVPVAKEFGPTADG